MIQIFQRVNSAVKLINIARCLKKLIFILFRMGFFLQMIMFAIIQCDLQSRHSTGTIFVESGDTHFFSDTILSQIDTFFAAPRQRLMDTDYQHAFLCDEGSNKTIDFAEAQFVALDERLKKFFDLHLSSQIVSSAEDTSKYSLFWKRLHKYRTKFCQKKDKGSIVTEDYGQLLLNFKPKEQTSRKQPTNFLTDIMVAIGGIPGFFGASSLSEEVKSLNSEVNEFFLLKISFIRFPL